MCCDTFGIVNIEKAAKYFGYESVFSFKQWLKELKFNTVIINNRESVDMDLFYELLKNQRVKIEQNIISTISSSYI